MAAILPARFWRFALPTAALLLATAGLTSAASNQPVSSAAGASTSATAAASASPATLVVPRVRGQAYVFAKGILTDSGFAWKVTGGVNGFAANLVAGQSPAPGTRLVDTGAPTITLRLERNARYAEDGIPENFSPFPGTRVLTPGAAKRPAQQAAPRPKTSRPAAKRPKATPTATKPKAARKATKPKAAQRAAKPKAAQRAGKPKTARTATKPKSKPQVKQAAGRPVAFIVPGAPKEPLNEMPLPRRARLLQAWVATHARPTDANVAHWLYQHAWIVTGAKFGWWRGAEALRILIAVDRRVISNWGIGTRSLTTARATLAEVKAKSR